MRTSSESNAQKLRVYRKPVQHRAFSLMVFIWTGGEFADNLSWAEQYPIQRQITILHCLIQAQGSILLQTTSVPSFDTCHVFWKYPGKFSSWLIFCEMIARKPLTSFNARLELRFENPISDHISTKFCRGVAGQALKSISSRDLDWAPHQFVWEAIMDTSPWVLDVPGHIQRVYLYSESQNGQLLQVAISSMVRNPEIWTLNGLISDRAFQYSSVHSWKLWKTKGPYRQNVRTPLLKPNHRQRLSCFWSQW